MILSQQISRIDGVGLVTIGGQQKPAVRIQLDPRKVAARGLQIDTVRAGDRRRHRQRAQGLDHRAAAQTSPSTPTTRSWTPAPWNDLVVGYQNGAPVRIKDIGKAVASVENNQIGAWVYPGKANTDPTLKGGQGILLVDLQAARRQRHRDGGPDQRGAAGPAGQHPARHRHPYPDGPHPDHQRLGART